LKELILGHPSCISKELLSVKGADQRLNGKASDDTFQEVIYPRRGKSGNQVIYTFRCKIGMFRIQIEFEFKTESLIVANVIDGIYFFTFNNKKNMKFFS